MIHTPVHASWLNQIEIFFSVIQKKVLTPSDFASLGQLSTTLLAFVDRYNQTAKPFSWKYTAADPQTSSHGSANASNPTYPRPPDATPDELPEAPT